MGIALQKSEVSDQKSATEGGKLEMRLEDLARYCAYITDEEHVPHTGEVFKSGKMLGVMMKARRSF